MYKMINFFAKRCAYDITLGSVKVQYNSVPLYKTMSQPAILQES